MTWQDLEQGVETSRPLEGVEFILPSVTHRLATGPRDFRMNGQRFYATTSMRDALTPFAIGNVAELKITLDSEHPIVRRYMRNAVPPKEIVVKVWRQQPDDSTDGQLIWQGKVTSLNFDKSLASFLVSSTVGEIMQRRLPTAIVSRQCPHVLFDPQCRINPENEVVNTTVVTGTGGSTTIKVASMGTEISGWADGGFLIHVPSGERISIVSHVTTTLVIQLPIAELRAGDAVRVFAGCAHDSATCRSKFGNLVNFGGFSLMPKGNPHLPTGFGVKQSV